MGKHMVLIGAGHTHLAILKNVPIYFKAGHNVTVVNDRPYHYYPGMGPAMLSGIYEPQEIRFNVKQLTESQGSEFIEDKVISIDPDARTIRLESGKTIGYDVLSFNTGSEIDPGNLDTSYFNIFKAKPIENLFRARCDIITSSLKKRAFKIVVIGGGATGVEIANNAWRITTDLEVKAKITLISRETILNHFHPKVRKIAIKSMNVKGIILEENISVKGNTKKKIFLDNGKEIHFDFAFVATGAKPSDIFKNSGLPTGKDGSLLVNEYLQSIQYPEIFGSGDCISFLPHSHHKAGVYAAQENRVLLTNLHTSLSGGFLKSFKPRKSSLVILYMGNDTGILNRNSLTLEGKFAFKLKTRIDKKFMTKFQLSDELNDVIEWKTAITIDSKHNLNKKRGDR